MATSFGSAIAEVIADHPEYTDSEVAVAARQALAAERAAERDAAHAVSDAADLIYVAQVRAGESGVGVWR